MAPELSRGAAPADAGARLGGYPHVRRINPVVFSAAVLKKQSYGWQSAIKMSVWSGRPTVARTPNGAGKTSNVVTDLVLTFLHEYAGGTAVLTSATFRQVRDQLFAALKVEQGKFPQWKWNETSIETKEGGRVVGFATDSGGRFEGFHAYPDRPLLIIVDEAKTVAEDIFVAIDRCQPTFLLYISSPGGLLGRFHDAFKNPRFAAFEITAKDCPHITPEYIEAMKAQYGEDSDIYRSMVLGEFGNGADDGRVIPFAAWEHCLLRPPMKRTGARQVFCDFAESSDENVIAKRDGNVVEIHDAWVGDGNTQRVTMRFFERLLPLHREGYLIFGDADGTGHGYITALAQMGIPIQGVKNNSAPSDAHYFNLAAEMWWQLRRKIEKTEVVLPARDEVLKKQLLNREQVYREVNGKKIYGRDDGKLQLMPKSRLNTKSPDRADAVVGAAYDYPSMAPVKAMQWEDPEMGLMERARIEEGAEMEGAFCP